MHGLGGPKRREHPMGQNLRDCLVASGPSSPLTISIGKGSAGFLCKQKTLGSKSQPRLCRVKPTVTFAALWAARMADSSRVKLVCNSSWTELYLERSRLTARGPSAPAYPFGLTRTPRIRERPENTETSMVLVSSDAISSGKSKQATSSLARPLTKFLRPRSACKYEQTSLGCGKH